MKTQTVAYQRLGQAEQQPDDILPPGKLLEFDLGERWRPDSTLYNPSTPFPDISQGERRTFIMLRHEGLYSETDSEVLVFDCASSRIVPEAPVFKNMQDPYYMGQFRDKDNELYHVIGGVKIAVNGAGKITGYQDALFRYKQSIMELGGSGSDPEPWVVGVPNWKDTRAVQLAHGILGMPRPQGAKFGGAGKIGQFETKNLDTFTKDLFRYAAEQDQTTLIDGVFEDGHWGGAGQLLAGADGRTIHVSAHDAHYDEMGLKEYVSTYFRYDWVTKKLAGRVIVLGTADDFPYVEPKPGHGLGKVAFNAGSIPCNDRSGDRWQIMGIGDRVPSVVRVPRSALMPT